MYPQAEIPLLQLSLPSSQGATLQLLLGKILAPLREQGILLIGSGSITHNLRPWTSLPAIATQNPGPRRFVTG